VVDQLLRVCEGDVDDGGLFGEEGAQLFADGGAEEIGVVGGKVGESERGFDCFDLRGLLIGSSVSGVSGW
jgi:hypothetical protein